MDTQLGKAFSHWRHIAEVAKPHAIKASINPHTSMLILQPIQPLMKSITLDNLIHEDIVSYKIQLSRAILIIREALKAIEYVVSESVKWMKKKMNPYRNLSPWRNSRGFSP